MAEERFDDKTIAVIDPVELIRKRPGMYVGDVENRTGIHYMLEEVMQSALDAFFGGHATGFEVVLHSDGSASVSDDGEGISLELDEVGQSWLETILTTGLRHQPSCPPHPSTTHRIKYAWVLAVVTALSSRWLAYRWRDARPLLCVAGRYIRPGRGRAAARASWGRLRPRDTPRMGGCSP